MKTPGQILKDYEPALPNRFSRDLTILAARIYNLFHPAKFIYKFDKKWAKGRPVLLLFQHLSVTDPYHVMLGYPFIMPNVIMGLQNMLVPGLFELLLGDGVIPKMLYVNDVRAARSILKLRKKGASIGVFPEGIQSMDGAASPLDPATAKLVKKLGLDTVLCSGHGSYLSRPRFDSHIRKGRIKYTYEILFSKEELVSLTEDEIYERLLENFKFNDFEWNSRMHYRYKGKVPNATGLDKILFICPYCKKQFTMRVEGEYIKCSCGESVHVDEFYDLKPVRSPLPFKRIDEWYLWQRGIIEEEVQKDDFSMSFPVDHRLLSLNRLRSETTIKIGSGTVTLNKEQYVYSGTDNGDPVELRFDISKMPSAPFVSGTGSEFYYDNIYHRFVITSDQRLSVKVLMAVETLHNMNDESRRKAYLDSVRHRMDR